MKVLLSAIFIVFCTCVTCGKSIIYNGDPGSNTEITVRDVTSPGGPEIQRRVQAFMDPDMEQVTVQFNASVGNEVTVTIIAISGATISMTVCDSEVEPLVLLPLPPKGVYLLKVESDTYEGEGTFIVQ